MLLLCIDLDVWSIERWQGPRLRNLHGPRSVARHCVGSLFCAFIMEQAFIPHTSNALALETIVDIVIFLLARPTFSLSSVLFLKTEKEGLKPDWEKCHCECWQSGLGHYHHFWWDVFESSSFISVLDKHKQICVTLCWNSLGHASN